MNTKSLIIIAALYLLACTKEEITPRDYPRVMTREATNLVNGGATFKGEITFASTPVSDHGFIWTVDGFPTLTNGKKESLGAKNGVGTFDFRIEQGLKAKTKYSTRAYAISNGKVVYGNVLDFVGK